MSNYAKLPGEGLGGASFPQNHNPSDASPNTGLGELSPVAPTESAPLTHNTAPKRKRAETNSDAIGETQRLFTEPRNQDTTNHVQDINASDHSRIHVGNNNYYSFPKMDEECLRHLHVINPETHKKEIEKTKGGLLKDSYDWILDHKDFKAFRNSPGSRLLWIKGDPGKGKTMLLCGIVDELSKEPSQLTSFYFCQATNTKLRKATSVVRSLIWLLCKKKPELISCVRAKYDIEGEMIFQGFCALESLKEILTNMIEQPAAQGAILVVDALDECADDDRQDLIGLILKLSRTAHAKWIVSSRNWPTIEEQFSLTSNVRIILELNKDAINEAVKMYVRKKVDELSQIKRYDTKTKEAVIETLLDKSENTFLWVGLACRQLSEVKLRHTMAKLRTVPRGLAQMYERMLEQIWASDDRDICREVLATACIAYRPVAMGELCVLAPELMKFGSDELEEIVKECGSFLALENGVVYFVHQTAKDFLMCKKTDILGSGIPEHHRILFQRSMEVLSGLKRNMYDLKHLGILLKEVVCPNPDPLSPLRYSTMYWIDHLEQVEQRRLSDDEAVEHFIRTKFLTWLEVMSLQSKMYEVVVALDRLRVIMQNTAVHGLKDLVEDGQRFMLMHITGIEIAPLQVYASALLFSPTNSLIRKLFEEDELDWIAVKPQLEENWDACIHTLECGEDVQSLAISADGRRIAVGMTSAIEVWDVPPSKSVEYLSFFGRASSVFTTSIALSRNGHRILVALMEDGQAKIGIWDPGSDGSRDTFQFHHSQIKDAQFSPDGKLIAICSGVSGVEIWDSDATRCIRTLQHAAVASLSFSENGLQLASHSYDGAVKVWDVTTGTCTWKLESHMGIPSSRSVAFLAPNLLVSSASYYIKIWNTVTGACIQTIEIRNGKYVCSINTLGNDRLFASTTDDGLIQVWDGKGVCIQTLQTLQGNRIWGGPVVASSSGDLIASSSREGTVKFWDVTKVLATQTTSNHSHKSFSIRLSPDGRRLVSCGAGEFGIWDASNGTHISTIEANHTGVAVNAPIFSPDGRWLAYMNRKFSRSFTTLDIWSMVNFKLTLTLDEVALPAVFSSDGRLLAVRCKHRIDVWEIETQTLIQTFMARVLSMAFSVDNGRIVSATDREVLIWDISEGALVQAFKHWCPRHSTIPLTANSFAMLGIETIDVLDLGTGALMTSIRLSHGSITQNFSTALSPNGKWVVLSTRRGLQVWNVDTGTAMLRVEIPSSITWFRFEQSKSSQLHTPFRIIELDELLAPRTVENDVLQSISDDDSSYEYDSELEELLDQGTVENSVLQSIRYDGYSYGYEGDDENWILRGGERVLWLPPDFRVGNLGESEKRSGRINVMGSTVAMCPTSTGRAFFIQFR